MAHAAHHEDLHGKLLRLLFSPKGSIEGFLLEVESKTVQVTIESAALDAAELPKAVGKKVNLKATLDRSHKAKDGAHPVYHLEEFVRVEGRAASKHAQPLPVTGVVAAIHYAKHGEPNGVILETGEFIHTRPPGMKKLRLSVGSTVVATGDTRMTVLGTRLIEAHEVNEVALE